MKNRLKKSQYDRVFTGVCGGLAEYFGISSLAVRLIFIFTPSFFVYIILMIFMPNY